ncbi:uncharacterized protein PV06_08449 [Exophiala oligosperma]|uniref:CHL4 family chromosome segregation protein n=1 Tax=Exophiala oligosperma TaxID=215243 RepID=A0A0D2BQU7_9EURO|nr:uncharacterized protein PV06_08449 [Exophiala oligosperma]KIW39877.1 hypothetical protein PV06_08449 [Exophiala oligosperma]
MAPVLATTLNRLSRDSLLDLAVRWLDQDRAATPYLCSNRRLFEADEEDYLYAPAATVAELRRIYKELQKDSSLASKRNVIDRVIDGDWRRGFTLHQHAMVDFAYLEQNDTALRWSALRLVPLEAAEESSSEDSDTQPPSKRRKHNYDDAETKYPQISAQTFLSTLKEEISPVVKAHYHLHKIPSPHNLHIIRLYFLPNSTFGGHRTSIPRRPKHATDTARVMYIALPDSCPYVYVSLSGATGSKSQSKGIKNSKARAMAKMDMAALKKIVLEAIPKALSRPHQRWALESTKLNARSLRALAELKGNHKPGSGGGAYSKFAEDERAPNVVILDTPIREDEGTEDESRNLMVAKRFGAMNGKHHAALDRVHVKLQGLVEADTTTTTTITTDSQGQETSDVTLVFNGTDVFKGLEQLAQLGGQYVDLTKMPAWMTGELGVSNMTV